MKRHKYTEEEKEFFKDFVFGHSHKEIQQAFIDKFKWDITLNQIKYCIKRYHLSTGISERFKKGHLHKKYKPIGSELINIFGYVELKTADGWIRKHRVVWEQANGKIPPSHVIMFKDGNKLNTDIDNLMLVSRKVLAVMNSSGLYKSGYIETAALMAELNIKVIEKKKNARHRE